jgi:hypothetical protein
MRCLQHIRKINTLDGGLSTAEAEANQRSDDLTNRTIIETQTTAIFDVQSSKLMFFIDFFHSLSST